MAANEKEKSETDVSSGHPVEVEYKESRWQAGDSRGWSSGEDGQERAAWTILAASFSA